MKADRVEVSRDKESQRWLIRIQVGEEVIRRHTSLANDSDESTLRKEATKAAGDEGYTVDPADIVIV